MPVLCCNRTRLWKFGAFWPRVRCKQSLCSTPLACHRSMYSTRCVNSDFVVPLCHSAYVHSGGLSRCALAAGAGLGSAPTNDTFHRTICQSMRSLAALRAARWRRTTGCKTC